MRVLVVTTFHVDAYVYEALRAGASGFLLKDARPAELIGGYRQLGTGAAIDRGRHVHAGGGDPGCPSRSRA